MVVIRILATDEIHSSTCVRTWIGTLAPEPAVPTTPVNTILSSDDLDDCTLNKWTELGLSLGHTGMGNTKADNRGSLYACANIAHAKQQTQLGFWRNFDSYPEACDADGECLKNQSLNQWQCPDTVGFRTQENDNAELLG